MSNRSWRKAEKVLDAAISAFLQSAVATWTGGDVPYLINKALLPHTPFYYLNQRFKPLMHAANDFPSDSSHCLYLCRIFHCRLLPKRYQFENRIFMFGVDLDAVESLRLPARLVRAETPALYSFYARDHFGKFSDVPLRPRLDAWLAERGVHRPARVHFVTNLRFAGYVFNPIAVYFCSDVEGEPVAAVAQVGNTFGEQKLYLVPRNSDGTGFQLRCAKHFYVSPFSEPDWEFDFRFDLPTESLRLFVDEYRGGEKVLVSSLVGRRLPLEIAPLLRFTAAMPFVTLRVIFMIHWHALWLWLKRIPWFPKHYRKDAQRDVLNPLD